MSWRIYAAFDKVQEQYCFCLEQHGCGTTSNPIPLCNVQHPLTGGFWGVFSITSKGFLLNRYCRSTHTGCSSARLEGNSEPSIYLLGWATRRTHPKIWRLSVGGHTCAVVISFVYSCHCWDNAPHMTQIFQVKHQPDKASLPSPMGKICDLLVNVYSLLLETASVQ